MSNLGRPTAYKPEDCELAHNYCLLGATAEELAGFFDVTRGTINNWIATIAGVAGPAFGQAEPATAPIKGTTGSNGRPIAVTPRKALGRNALPKRGVLPGCGLSRLCATWS